MSFHEGLRFTRVELHRFQRNTEDCCNLFQRKPAIESELQDTRFAGRRLPKQLEHRANAQNLLTLIRFHEQLSIDPNFLIVVSQLPCLLLIDWNALSLSPATLMCIMSIGVIVQNLFHGIRD